jgi:hypothetical protein
MQRIVYTPECVSELVLDQWYAGELSAREIERTEQHVARCTTCRERNRVLHEEHARFLTVAPSFAAHTELTARRGKRSRTLVAVASAAALAACVLLSLSKPSGFDQHDTRPKGGPELSVYIKRGAHVFRGTAQDTVQPGDLLRFKYSAGHAGYLAIFGADARAATTYYPPQPDAAPIAAGLDLPLDFAVKLDEQLGIETTYALWCPTTFAVEPVRKQLAEQRAMTRPDDACTISVLPLRKQAAQ